MTTLPAPRRPDLDALRAVAMLLGIVLHASIAYVPVIPWPVHDARPVPWLVLVFLAIHGFRMPVFFLLSGFFTALLRARRGTRGMLVQRFRRVILPLALCCVTLLPLFNVLAAGGWERARAWAAAAGPPRAAPDREAGDARAGAPRRPEAALVHARDAYRAWLLDPGWSVRPPGGGRPRSLVFADAFGYLWFLWFLCWLVPAFAACAWVATRLGLPAPPRWAVASPLALAWTIPLTLLPQVFMGLFVPVFGPDTSTGVVPQPHVLAYYGAFFVYGALLFHADDGTGTVGRRWPLALAAALVICFPVGLATLRDPMRTALPQAAYAWLMCFAAIGLFRRLVPQERRAWRYLSDSAYFLYLAHLPLLIAIQRATATWHLPGGLKFVLVCAATTAILVAGYQLFVRHTPLGVLLDGRRRAR